MNSEKYYNVNGDPPAIRPDIGVMVAPPYPQAKVGDPVFTMKAQGEVVMHSAQPFDSLKETSELKKRVAKLEGDLEEMRNNLVKLYWAVDKLSDLDWHI